MLTKASLSMPSRASGSVAYDLDWMDQSVVPHVEVPIHFFIVKDLLAGFPNTINSVRLGKNSLAISPDVGGLPSALFDEKPFPSLGDVDYLLNSVRLGKNSLAISPDVGGLPSALFDEKPFPSLGDVDYLLNSVRLGKNSLAISPDVGGLPSALFDEKPFPSLGDVDYFVQIDVNKPSFFSEPEWTQLLYRLHAAFKAEPLEDGIDHPAEQIIKKVLQSPKDQLIFDWFENLSLDIKRPSFAASILRCLGRQANLGTSSWRTGLIRKSLAIDNVEIRDAAVQATESWDDPGLADILRSHHEAEPWLHEYILSVIDDLGR